jgi:hypothetical protein
MSERTLGRGRDSSAASGDGGSREAWTEIGLAPLKSSGEGRSPPLSHAFPESYVPLAASTFSAFGEIVVSVSSLSVPT